MEPLYNAKSSQRENVKLHFNHNQELNLDFRSEFRKDYGRLLHSPAFRRLQGKTQLFPGIESDFFRNRLTHSLEVAQIAKGLAIHLNCSAEELRDEKLDLDLIEFAALAHDLGHPPFGHNGEEALNEIMKKNYGYEGNAQTLRILTTLEKRYIKNTNVSKNLVEANETDFRSGLNLTYRSLASIIKYDNQIPKDCSEGPVKGYYHYNSDLVHTIKSKITGHKNFTDKFKTIECHLMDIADDIAYSTYDFEDSLKASFLHLLDVFSPESNLLDEVTKRVNKNLLKAEVNIKLNSKEVLSSYLILISSAIGLESGLEAKLPQSEAPFFVQAGQLYDSLTKIANDGYYRTHLTSRLVGRFINGVRLEFNPKIPALSKVYLDEKTRVEVEVLKNLIFVSQIESPKLGVAQFRGKEIIHTIFNAIKSGENGLKLLPYDFQKLLLSLDKNDQYNDRIIVDFIAGMTDRYAIEFYGRLKSESPETIFKPI